MKVLALFLLVVIAGLAASSPASAQERVEKFQVPDVRDFYCGVEVSYIFCQCAFHDVDESCTAAQMDQDAARQYVRSGFKEWVGDLIETFAANCIRNNGEWDRSRRTCTYPGPDEPQTIEERYSLPDLTGKPSYANPGVLAKVSSIDDCKVFVYMTAFQRWRGPVQPGQPIYHSDVIVTRGAKHEVCAGEAQFTFFHPEGERTMSISGETWFELPPPPDVPSQEPFLTELKNGAVRIFEELSESGQWQSPFNVRGPTVVAGIRGTEFLFAYDESTGASEILVIDGEVEVLANGATEPVVLTANQGATNDGASFQTFAISDDDWNDALREHGLDGELISVPEEERVAPTGPPVEFTRAELVGDLSFLDDQFGGGGFPAKGIFVGLLIAGIVALMAGAAVIVPMLLLPPESRLRR